MTINAKESKTDKFKLASIVLALTTVASLGLFFIAATAYESKNAALIAETDSHLETIKSLRQSTELAKVFIAKTTTLSEQVLQLKNAQVSDSIVQTKTDGKVIEILTENSNKNSYLIVDEIFSSTALVSSKNLRGVGHE